MIDPQYQWAIQIDVTNVCNRRCSNCTRLTSHVRQPFYMSVSQFKQAAEALKDFPAQSPPAQHCPTKLVGILGGEPLLHPEFAKLVHVMRKTIPVRAHRGLWTGLEWQNTCHRVLIDETFGYINNNRHDSRCVHTPILVAISDFANQLNMEPAVLIDNCWLQRLWSGTITPKGFFFCEVAGAMDMVFGGPGGLPIEPDCWRRPLSDFQQQMDLWCQRCGIPLNVAGRSDAAETDDVSESNLRALEQIGSPRVAKNEYVLHSQLPSGDDHPWRYLR